MGHDHLFHTASSLLPPFFYSLHHLQFHSLSLFSSSASLRPPSFVLLPSLSLSSVPLPHFIPPSPAVLLSLSSVGHHGNIHTALPIPTQEKSFRLRARVLRSWFFPQSAGVAAENNWEVILLDEWGNRMQASVRESLWPKYERYLADRSCCIILNFAVGRVQATDRTTPNPYKISFASTTLVRPSDELPNLDKFFAFAPIDQILAGILNNNMLIDCIGEVVTAGAPEFINCGGRRVKCLTVQIKDLDHQVIDCTLWAQLANEVYTYINSEGVGSVVLACQLFRIHTWGGRITIRSVRYSSRVFINADMPQVEQFAS